MIAVLASVLPLLLAAALAVRRPPPTDPHAAGSLAPPRSGPPGATRKVASVPPAPAIGVELAGGAVRLEPGSFEERPDVLLYWLPGRPAPDATWLQDAYLLGPARDAFDGFLPLPGQAAETGGWLVLYSLAHREVVVELQLPPPGREG